jgi:hypothetical protein
VELAVGSMSQSDPHGYEPTREAAVAAFAKGWPRREQADRGSIQKDSGLPQGPAGASGAS